MISFKPINTCLSVDFLIDSDQLAKAKNYLAVKYGNIYNFAPHATLSICPFPQYNLKKVIPRLETVIRDQSVFRCTLGTILFEPKRRFYSIPIEGDTLFSFHQELFLLSNEYRDGYVREKDVEKIAKHERTDEEVELIEKYGYFRVMENYHPHITIGNIENISGFEEYTVTGKLEELLGKDIPQTFEVKEIEVIFHTDSETQSEMQNIWDKKYTLKSSS